MYPVWLCLTILYSSYVNNVLSAPLQTYVLLGKSISLPCKPPDSANGVQWELQTDLEGLRGTRMETGDTLLGNRIKALKNNDLLLRMVQRDFRGIYNCAHRGRVIASYELVPIPCPKVQLNYPNLCEHGECITRKVPKTNFEYSYCECHDNDEGIKIVNRDGINIKFDILQWLMNVENRKYIPLICNVLALPLMPLLFFACTGIASRFCGGEDSGESKSKVPLQNHVPRVAQRSKEELYPAAFKDLNVSLPPNEEDFKDYLERLIRLMGMKKQVDPQPTDAKVDKTKVSRK